MHGANMTHKHLYKKKIKGEGAGAIAPVPSLHTHGRPIRMWEGNIKMDVEDVFKNEQYSTNYAYDHWWALVNPVMNI